MTEGPTAPEPVVTLVIHLTPRTAHRAFHATVTLGGHAAPWEFDDPAAFARFVARLTDRRAPGLR